MILPLPEPYSFDLSLERYRTFSPDPAALWHEGGLHRVFRGVEVRIEAAPGGVRIEPGAGRLVAEVEFASWGWRSTSTASPPSPLGAGARRSRAAAGRASAS